MNVNNYGKWGVSKIAEQGLALKKYKSLSFEHNKANSYI